MLTMSDVNKKFILRDKVMYDIVKRTFDLLFAINLLVILSPLFIILALMIKLDSKGPVVYKQKRIGKKLKVFAIYKFRTMYLNTPTIPTKDCDPNKYVTKVGKFLRLTSLDELPQIFNIIKGEMSFIGYRPLIINEPSIHEYRKELLVYTIKPGITGIAQISGRDLVEPYDKAYYDYFYLVNRNILLDMKILFLTFFKVLKHQDVYDGKSTIIVSLPKNNQKAS